MLMSSFPFSPLNVPIPSNGLPNEFRISWDSFVQIVLENTLEAYQRMRRNCVAKQDWEEDKFTAVLAEDYIQPLLRERGLSLLVELQNPVYTRAMKSGPVSTNTARKIDMKLYIPQWDYVVIYFAWECKLVGDKQRKSEYAALLSKYVKEGIFRFIDGNYSSEVSDAGMLGYVLEGNVSNIVRGINESMLSDRRRRRLSSSDQLLPLAPPVDFGDAYVSQHHRTEQTEDIRLQHLFLSFDFI